MANYSSYKVALGYTGDWSVPQHAHIDATEAIATEVETARNGQASLTSGLAATYQAKDATLTALAALTTGADKLIYATGTDTFSTTTLGSAGRTFLSTPSSANLALFLTGITGTAGSVVFSISPTFTGTPLAPTAAADTNTTQIATTAHVYAERSNTATLTNKTLTSPTLTTPTLGVATATSVNKVAITAPATSATLTIANGATLATAGAYSITLTSTAATNVTLPTTGTLATLAGAETLTNKTLTSPTVSGGTINNTTIGATTATTGKFTTVTASTGILFGTDTAAANTLDDYEEGTWTPVVAGATVAGTYELTNNNSSYTKIGNCVTLYCDINIASTVTGGGSGYFTITSGSIPFHPSSRSANSCVGGVYHYGLSTTYETVLMIFSANSLLLSSTDKTTNQELVPISVIGSGTKILRFTITYFV